MNPLTLERAQKADGDYTKFLAQASAPVYDAICFHAQQCVEKYLKAWLQEANIAFRPRS
jgi:HEPN domain-containing protein